MRVFKNLIVVFALGVVTTGSAQLANDRLRAELEAMRESDQRDRANVQHYLPGAQRDSVIAHMTQQDAINLARVTAIIDSAGWLGEEVVGRVGNQALFLILQHADARPDVQAHYLELMREAVDAGKARAEEWAMLVDRVEVNHGRPQVYGSQIGWTDGKPHVKPMIDEQHVNERRASVGLEPLERYAERFGFTWAPPLEKERVLLLGPAKP